MSRGKKPVHASYYMATGNHLNGDFCIWGTMPDGRRVIITLTQMERKQLESFIDKTRKGSEADAR